MEVQSSRSGASGPFSYFFIPVPTYSYFFVRLHFFIAFSYFFPLEVPRRSLERSLERS